MTDARHRVKVEGGKYEFVSRGGYVLDVLRNGEPFVANATPSKAIGAMMAELDAARVVLEAARRLATFFETMPVALATSLSRYDEFVGVTRALARHDGLVEDLEPPSEWTK